MIEYDSAKRPPPFIDEFIQIINYRDLVLLMVEGILKNRYKRSALGVLWMFLNPLLQTIVLSIAFGVLFRSSIPNYAVYLLSGLIAWNFITQTTQYAMGMMVNSGSLLKRIYIPRATYIFASIGNGLVNFLISLVPLAVIAIFFDHPFKASWFFLPISILILSLFTLGLALFLATVAVFFTDLIDIYQIIIQALFFLTPLIYPLSIIPDHLRVYMALNPFAVFIELFRTPIYYNTIPDTGVIVSSLLITLVMLTIGWMSFANKADQLAYHL